jgi:hypothetical protein
VRLDHKDIKSGDENKPHHTTTIGFHYYITFARHNNVEARSLEARTANTRHV